MDPMKLITYIAATAVTALLVIGGLGFYAGYSAGRRDISEVKAYIAAARLNLPVGAAGREGAPSATISLEPGALDPVMTEIKALGEAMADLQQRVSASESGGKSSEDGKPRDEARAKEDSRLREELTQARQKLVEMTREEDKLKTELAAVRQRAAEVKEAPKGGQLAEELTTARALLAQSNSQASACQIQITALENRLKETEGKSAGHAKGDPAGRPGGGADSGSTLFYDSVTLKRAQSKVYGEVDVALSLEGVTARAARVAINKQGFSINFGERKVFQHNDATCELVLMESDLEANQARFNITCKR